MRFQLRFVLLTAAILLTITFVLAIAFGTQKSPSGTSSTRHDKFDGAVFPAGVHAHGFTLTDQYGHKLSLRAYRGGVVALTFLATDCRACTLVAQQVRGALDELGSDPGVRTVFVTTDPSNDSPAHISRFLHEVSLTGRVAYLTGTQTQLRPIWHVYGVAPVSAGKSASETDTTVLLIDRSGLERVGFGLEQVTPEGLSHDIRLLRSSR